MAFSTFSNGKKMLVAALVGVSFFAGAAYSSCRAEAPEYTQTQLNEQLVMGLSWMQNSAEYRALCYQAYNVALDRVKEAAAKHKKGDKPLAIILDADETVLDNTAFMAGLLGEDRDYNGSDWTEWCDAAQAKAMPGAAEYLQAVDKLGVEIFYASNRSLAQVPGTKKNFEVLGFPQADEKHMIFQDTSKKDSHNKHIRFREVMEKYDVVVFMGDNAGDFLMEIGGPKDVRNQDLDSHKAEFGKRFIIFPNPIYGGWEASLAKNGGYYKLTPEQKNELRKSLLRAWKPSGTADANAIGTR